MSTEVFKTLDVNQFLPVHMYFSLISVGKRSVEFQWFQYFNTAYVIRLFSLGPTFPSETEMNKFGEDFCCKQT